ncbi:RNA recognition motif protein [Gregarina niphandrodes]|uniref:RNA recognition motif protein n=1 Tax=Gregarina niphandrodes TaxID=110365 RepID=A0A023B9F8_GRENI|nr:RNA recognition motif protein [Gregarina niphandrodes]EZG72951.1 RNA recognition motif protein [Gregarina niphandrodes]|eukprot:XP_011129710.1 RNA recognition motif protein [Gregarina niphandrodes]
MNVCIQRDIPADELAVEFEKIGKVLDINIKKTVSDESYAFVHFADKTSAAQAVKELDNIEIAGKNVRVELPLEKRPYRSVPPPRSKAPLSHDVARRPKLDRSRRGTYAIHVSGLPASGSWQDLKDHFREGGECVYADVGRDGSGVVEYPTLEEARHAIRVCRGLTFTSHQGESSRIRLQLGDDRRDDRRLSDDRRDYDPRDYDARDHDRRDDMRDRRDDMRDRRDDWDRGRDDRRDDDRRPPRGEPYGRRPPPRRRDRSPPR